MYPPKRDSPAFIHLDALRGLAALSVAVGHVRLLLVENGRSVAHPHKWTALFYLFTSMGPEAVMVFFVLSGFLVGSSAAKSFKEGRFGWRGYLSARASRIFTVLLPALCIGGIIDFAGVKLLGSSVVYSTPHYGVMLPESVLANLNPMILLGNILCLQKIFVDPFGSNGALWSLANEVWYYALFPLMLSVLSKGSTFKWRSFSLFLAAAIFWMLTSEIRWLYLVWLLGASIAFLPKVKVRSWHALLAAIACFVCWAGASWKHFAADAYLVGLSTAVLVYCLTATNSQKAVSPLYARASVQLSGLSYTLYLFHTPFVVFIAALILGNRPKFQPGVSSVLMTLGVMSVALFYSYLMWLLFEKRTQSVRDWLDGGFKFVSRSQPPRPLNSDPHHSGGSRVPVLVYPIDVSSSQVHRGSCDVSIEDKGPSDGNLSG